MRWGYTIALIALFGAQAPALAAQQQQAPADPARDSVAALLRRASASRSRGARTATVTVFEVADFQCPFCAQFANQAFARIDSAYIRPGKVEWVFVNMPLTIHPNAFQAAEAALCAGGVAGKFWEMHARLYAAQPEWEKSLDPFPLFLGYARAAGVPEDAYSACVRTERVWPVIMQDATYAAAGRIDGTPTYIIGQQVVAVGAKSFEEWKPILDKALQDAAAKKTP